MQSINNMASAASKAIWGTNGTTEEPVSGKSGDVSKGEPYDAGNMGGMFSKDTCFFDKPPTRVTECR